MNGAQSFVLRGQDTKECATLTGRTDLWKVSLGMFTLRPLLGYGFVASRAELLQVFSWSGEAPNALVESLFDLGAVGALCVWVPLINGIMRSAKRLSDWTASEDGAFACILGDLVFILLDGMATASFAGYLSYDPAVMMTVLIVTAALDRRVASHREAGLSAVSPIAPESVPVEYGLSSHI